MNTETPIPANDNLLSGVDVDFEYASTGQRFLNFLIDYLFIIIIPAFILGFMIALMHRADVYSQDDASTFGLGWNLAFILLYVAYYTFCEFLFKGRTLGKLITGTRAVRTDNQPLTFSNALLRSLSRLVPFEIFSGFGTPWHDSWTGTMVIKAR